MLTRANVVETQRFPVAPLLALVWAGYQPESTHAPLCPSVSYAARRLGLSTTAVYRAKKGGLRPADADRWAMAAGFHPVEVWADWLEAAS